MSDTELDAIRERLARNGVLGVTDAAQLLAEIARLKAKLPVVTVIENGAGYWRPDAVTSASGTPTWIP